MSGFLAITTGDWIEYLKNHQISSAVFWCKKKNFIALLPGEKFYFLERGKFSSNSDRFIVGSGVFKTFARVNAADAWRRYSNCLGFDTFDSFLEQINSIYHDKDIELGCIELDHVVFYKQIVSLAECGVEFSPYIVSGKRLDLSDCLKIEEKTKEINYE